MSNPLPLGIFILASGSALFVTYFSMKRWAVPGSKSLLGFGVALASWALVAFYLAILTPQTYSNFIFYSRFFAVIASTLIFTFVLEYSNKNSWLNARTLALLALVPFVALLLSLVHSINGLLNTASLAITTLYFNGLIAASIILLVKTFTRSPLPHRIQSSVILAGTVLIIPASLIGYISGSLISISLLWMTAFSLTGIVIAFGMYYYQLLEITPIPRDVVVERMTDGWVMLDTQNRIVDLNPAAETVIGLPREKVFGLPAENILTDWSSIINQNENDKELEVRGRINLNNTWRYLSLRVSPLMDLRGNQFGRLIVWRDITESKRAEEARQLARDEVFMLLHSISNSAGRAANIDEFLEDTIYQIVYSFKSQACAILLVEENVNASEPRRMTLAAQHGLPAQIIETLSSLTELDPLINETLRNSTPVLVPDARINSSTQKAIVNAGFSSMILAPIMVQKQALGVIALARNEFPPFSEDEAARITVVADEIASFIHSDRQRQLAIALAERQRLVRDLHDSTTQKLYGLLTLTEAAQAGIELGTPEQLKPILSRIGETARQALKEMRLFLYELQPVDLERDGLVSILNQRLTAVEGRADVKARLLTDETISLPIDKEVALYYIAQEALNNVLKHAKAKTVTVRLKQTPANVKLEIEDDGSGFTPRKDDGGMGMRNMKERAAQVGGKLSITSIPGKGTKISATVSKDRQTKIHLTGYPV